MSKEIYTVIGLGKTGLSCVKFLLNQNFKVFVCDTREEPPNLATVKKLLADESISLGKIDQDFLEQADTIVLSPGVSRDEPEIAKQIQKEKRVIGDIELFCRFTKAPIVAITGTNGKSTVTTLVGEMARCAGVNVKVGGNLGTPVLDLMTTPEPELYVIELSSFQLESTNSLKAEVAVVLNLTPDHLDQHGTFENYKKAKFRIFDHCKSAVVNLDDEGSFPFGLDPGLRRDDNSRLDNARVNCLSFSAKQHAAFHLEKTNNELFLCQNKTPVLSVNELKIKGMHQYSNVLAALAIGTLINLPVDSMCKALREFEGLPHRCQLVKLRKNIGWYNDSKATTVHAALASIASIAVETSGQIILLAGGLGKGQDFAPLKNIAKYLRAAILFGEDEKLLFESLQGQTEIYSVSNLEEAVNKANILATSGDAVLLAPVCASYDMFDSFEHRGKCFEEFVRELS